VVHPDTVRDTAMRVHNAVKMREMAAGPVKDPNAATRAPEPTPEPAAPTEPAKIDPPRKKSWLDRQVLERVQVTGSRRLGYHSHNVEGDEEAYDSLNYYGRGGQRFTDTGNMSIAGNNVLGFLNFNLNYSSDQYSNPDAERITLNYNRGPWRIAAGDINGRLLNTNPFASFAKSLRGASAEYRAGRVRASILRSEVKGSSRTISLQGNNSSGPFYLQSGRLIPDSIQVQVDGQPMRLMDDYVVNADIGSITFVNRVIPPTSTLVVSYESYGFGVQGLVQGGGVSYDLGKFGQIGLTGIEQRSGISGTNTIVQRYFGFGSASAQYWLDYEPLAPTDPIRFVVKVDGVVQTLGADYYFDPTTNLVFYFTRPIGTTQQIDVVYVPKSTQSLDGDRRVWGFDYRLPLGGPEGENFIQYSQASGQLLSDSNPQSGTARGIQGQYKLGEFTLRGSTKDVPRDYVSVQSTGFQRNEQTSEIGLDWTRGRYSVTTAWSNSSISNAQQGSNNQLVAENSRFTRAIASLNYLSPDGTAWALSQSRVRSRLADETQLDTTSLSGKRRFGRLNTDYSLQYQTGSGPMLNPDTQQQEIGSVTLQTLGLGLRYELDNGLNLNGRTSVSKIQALDKTGDGSDYSFGLTYFPEGGRLRANANYSYSNSGQLATLGDFGSGYGYGYGGNGFSAGGMGTGLNIGSTSVRSLTASSTYQASSRLGLNVHALSTQAEGDLTSNSRSFSYGLGLDYDLGNFNQLGISLNRNKTDFFSEAAIQSSSTSLDAYLNGAPKGPWSYHLGISQFLSESSSLYAGDAFSFDAYLSYKLSPRQRLTLQYRDGRTTGYYGQVESATYASYEYQIFRNVALVGSYKWRNVKNLNGEVTGGAYRSNGFDLELSFDFR
ncbi:MAG TPA: hypothetical protein VGE01_00100, partial [Fimbriimonas sp.]